MTHDEMIAVIQAHKDGKTIQFRRSKLQNWEDSPGPAFAFDAFNYRIKPEPGLRPWTWEEVPVGAITRSKNKSNRLIAAILAADTCGAFLGGTDGVYSLGLLLECREHSTDGGKTWKPCGVEVAE